MKFAFQMIKFKRDKKSKKKINSYKKLFNPDINPHYQAMYMENRFQLVVDIVI